MLSDSDHLDESKGHSQLSGDMISLVCTFLNHNDQRSLGYTCKSFLHLSPISFRLFETILQMDDRAFILLKVHKVYLNICDYLSQYTLLTTSIQHCIQNNTKNNQPHHLEIYIVENSTAPPQVKFIPIKAQIPDLFPPAKQRALERVSINGNWLKEMTADFGADKDVVLAAVFGTSDALRFADSTLRADKQFMLSAVKKSGTALAFAASELRADKDIVLSAVSQDGYALKYAADALIADKEIVLASVSNYGFAYRYAGPNLRANKEVALTAVKQNGHILKYVSNDLRADKKIVIAAVSKYGHALQHAAHELRADKEVVLAAVNQNIYSLDYAAEQLQTDNEFAKLINTLIFSKRRANCIDQAA